VPALKPGSFHKSKKIIDLVEGVGCRVIFLPPYSPDLNPIEHHWAAMKSSIRQAAITMGDFYEAAVQTLSYIFTA